MTTTTAADAIGDAKDQVEDAVRDASPALKALARLGFVSKGVVYTIVGVLAILAATGSGGSTTDREGALRTIFNQPFGRTMLVIAGIGLFGYALWRLIQALFDPEHNKHDAKGFLRRIGRFASGTAHGALGFAAVQMAFGWGGGNDESADDWSVWLMAKPLGIWLVGILGLIVIAVGLWQLYRAWTTKLGKHLAFGQMSAAVQRGVIAFGRAGYAARGVIFCITGGFFIVAAYHHNPNEAKGFSQAMQHLSSVSYGRWLMGAVAIGLIAYGLFQFVEARYRRIEVC